MDSSGLSVIQGGLNDTFEIGLSGPSNLFTIPAWTDNVLDPYLYDTFGWDTEDAAGYILEPLDPTEDQFVGRHVWQSILGSKVSADEFYIESQIQEGFRIFGWSPEELGKLATVVGTGARLYWMGKIGEITGKITDVGQNLLVKLGSDFGQLWGSIKQNLTQSGHIYDNVSSDSVYSSFLSFYSSNSASEVRSYTYHLYDSYLIYTTSSGRIYIVTPDSTLTSLASIGTGVETYSSTDFPDRNGVWSGTITCSRSGSYHFVINGIDYYYFYLNFKRDGASSSSSPSTISPFSSLDDVKAYITAHGYPGVSASSVQYVDANGNPFDLQSLLNLLNGKYVTTDQLGQIKILIDGNPINADASGAHQIFSDDSVQALIDLINGIINEQDDLADELADNDPNPDPDPDPDPDPSWPDVPDDIPDWMVGVIPDLLPDEMFDIFKPVFDIVGTQYSMHSTFIAIPAILIVAFVVYFIVSVF